jgi:hypothetical protein
MVTRRRRPSVWQTMCVVQDNVIFRCQIFTYTSY